jgi:hypothetical protein
MAKKKPAAKAANCCKVPAAPKPDRQTTLHVERVQAVAEPEPYLHVKESPAAGGSFGGMVREMAGRAVENALDDPLTAVARVDSASSLAAKLLPTLPGEFPIPIPRGLYDVLPESAKKITR